MKGGQLKTKESEGKSRGSTWAEEAGVLDPARLSRYLEFLIDAKRWEGVTQTSAAVKASASACNLSAFISSRGTKQNISPSRIVLILATLGLHPQGLLTPGLHRWDLKFTDQEGMAVLGDLVRANAMPASIGSTAPVVVELHTGERFLLHRANRLTTVLARFPERMHGEVREALGTCAEERLAVDESAELLTLWTSNHNWVVERAIDTYIRRSKSSQDTDRPILQAV